MTPHETDTTLRSLLLVALGQLLLSGLMLGVYFAIGHFEMKILYSVAAGTGLSLLNFGVMGFFLLRASKAENPAKAKLYAGGTYGLRMVALLVILVILLKTGHFDPLATLIPLCFIRISIFITEFFRRKGAKPE